MDTPLALDLASPDDLEARREAEKRGEPFLLLRDDQGAQRIVELDERAGSVTVGRRLEADVPLAWDPEVSRLHAELEFKAGEWTLCDDGFSQNGTYVNGLRIHGRRRLTDGDLVRIGQTLDRVLRPGPERARRDARAGRAGDRAEVLRAAAAHPARAVPAADGRRRGRQAGAPTPRSRPRPGSRRRS